MNFFIRIFLSAALGAALSVAGVMCNTYHFWIILFIFFLYGVTCDYDDRR